SQLACTIGGNIVMNSGGAHCLKYGVTTNNLLGVRLAPVRRLICASPGYLAAHGEPKHIDELKKHRCLPAHNNDTWRLN
ncbi:FAD-binding protein, partial [Rhizobium ruizarguesonis]